MQIKCFFINSFVSENQNLMVTGFLLLEAVQKNCFLPSPKEQQKFTVSRILRTSPKLEGDSEIGIILYIGIGKQLGLTPSEIQNYLCIDRKEYLYKYNQFNILKNKARTMNKIKLITNYLKYRS